MLREEKARKNSKEKKKEVSIAAGEVKFHRVCVLCDWMDSEKLARIGSRLLFTRLKFDCVNLLKFLLHSTTRARIEEDVFVFCLTVYLDIYVIALWRNQK